MSLLEFLHSTVNKSWQRVVFNFNINIFLFLQVDTYGTQQPIALLKLLLEKGGMYDRGKELNFKNFRDIGFLAAMGKVSNLSFFF